MKQNSWLLLSVLFLLLIGCDKDDKNNDFLELETNSLTLEARGTGIEAKVKIRSTQKWQVADLPFWLEVYDLGSNPTEVLIRAKSENLSIETRKAKLIFYSGTASQTLKVTQRSLADQAPFIELKNKLPIDFSFTDIQHLELHTNLPWEINELPDWLHVQPRSGQGSESVFVRASSNEAGQARSFSLQIKAAGFEDLVVPIKQQGRAAIISSPSIHELFSFSHLKFQNDYTQIQAKTNKLFVNPSIAPHIYLGSLITYQPASTTDMAHFNHYTFNPIEVKSRGTKTLLSKSFLPSPETQQLWVYELISQQLDRVIDKRQDYQSKEFYDYHKLRQIGLLNIGVPLDTLLPLPQMQKKTGLLCSFKQVYFTLQMEQPLQLIQEPLSQEDQSQPIAYVKSMEYGKVGFLIVESNAHFRDIQYCIQRYLEDKQLNPAQTKLLEEAHITYVYFDNDSQVQCMQGTHVPLDEFMKAQTTPAANIYPVGFSLRYLNNHKMDQMSFTLQ